MKKQLLKDLERYSIAAIAITAINQRADGQVIYTDIRDTLLSQDGSHLIFLDLNNDGKPDFRFKAGEANDAYITAGGTGNSMIADSINESGTAVMYPLRLNYSDVISE